MHLAVALCMYFVITSPSPFSSQLLGEICSNKIALAAWIRFNSIPNVIREIYMQNTWGRGADEVTSALTH